MGCPITCIYLIYYISSISYQISSLYDHRYTLDMALKGHIRLYERGLNEGGYRSWLHIIYVDRVAVYG